MLFRSKNCQQRSATGEQQSASSLPGYITCHTDTGKASLAVQTRAVVETRVTGAFVNVMVTSRPLIARVALAMKAARCVDTPP